jgi:alkanesulfonate monooxygenase SsuD/methylene tetrahydromethanopterin reductase-like flavin-dependent oxidoreductase (luciferase family)
VGGRSGRSLRRAVELGDGWAPFALGPEDVARLLAAARQTDAWAARPAELEVVLQPVPPFDPLGAPDEARAVVAAHRDAGATALAVRLRHSSVDHYVEQLEALRALDAT